MEIRHVLLRASLASCIAAGAWPGEARAETSYFYRYVQPFLPKSNTPATDPSTNPDPPPQQVPKSTQRYWKLAGKVGLTYQTKLFDLGLFPHTSFVVNGTLLGNSPYAYWATSNDSTVGDLCTYFATLPDGPWECSVGYDLFATYQVLVITKYGDWNNTIDFEAVTNSGSSANPPELFGGATPQVYTINKY